MKTDAPSAFYLLRFDVVSFSRESKFRVLRNTIIGMTENTFIVKIINRYNVERVVLIFFLPSVLSDWGFVYSEQLLLIPKENNFVAKIFFQLETRGGEMLNVFQDWKMQEERIPSRDRGDEFNLDIPLLYSPPILFAYLVSMQNLDGLFLSRLSVRVISARDTHVFLEYSTVTGKWWKVSTALDVS